MTRSMVLRTLRNTVAAAVYILAVSQLLIHGQAWFGKADNLGPFALLLLFCLSAAVVGGLVFGESIRLILEDRKRESVIAAFVSVGWLAVITALAFVLLVVVR
jgi:hypothetical protein